MPKTVVFGLTGILTYGCLLKQFRVEITVNPGQGKLRVTIYPLAFWRILRVESPPEISLSMSREDRHGVRERNRNRVDERSDSVRGGEQVKSCGFQRSRRRCKNTPSQQKLRRQMTCIKQVILACPST